MLAQVATRLWYWLTRLTHGDPTKAAAPDELRGSSEYKYHRLYLPFEARNHLALRLHQISPRPPSPFPPHHSTIPNMQLILRSTAVRLRCRSFEIVLARNRNHGRRGGRRGGRAKDSDLLIPGKLVSRRRCRVSWAFELRDGFKVVIHSGHPGKIRVDFGELGRFATVGLVILRSPVADGATSVRLPLHIVQRWRA